MADRAFLAILRNPRFWRANAGLPVLVGAAAALYALLLLASEVGR